MDPRLPAHLEVAAIRRLAESQGGFSTVLHKGHGEAGTIGLVIICRDGSTELFERMPQLDGTRRFVRTRQQETENASEFSDALAKMAARDPDLWLIEADVPDRERFVAGLPA